MPIKWPENARIAFWVAARFLVGASCLIAVPGLLGDEMQDDQAKVAVGEEAAEASLTGTAGHFPARRGRFISASCSFARCPRRYRPWLLSPRSPAGMSRRPCAALQHRAFSACSSRR